MTLGYYNNIKLSEEELQKTYKIIEITYFRMQYSNVRINSNYYSGKANQIFNNKITKEDFFNKIDIWMNRSFRDNINLAETFNDIFTENKNYDFYNNNYKITKFILWKYENYIRVNGYDGIKNDAKADLINIQDFTKEKGNFATIEHIYPREDKSNTDINQPQ